MNLKPFGALAAAACMMTTPAFAESFEDMCLRVSADWGTKGDVASQCSCLDAKTSGKSALRDEMTMLAETQASDADAYEAGSADVKAVFDACSVDG